MEEIQNTSPETPGLSRREFLKTSAVGAAALLAAGTVNYAFAAGTDTIRVGLVGCGGRGSGAALNCASSSPGVELVVMADLFPDRLNSSRQGLKDQLGDKFKVTDDHAFTGFDAYQKALASDINYVILATPPGFRPMMLDAAVKAGKNIFMEKPVAVDATGVRSVMASSDLAQQKGLAVVAGTQRRHSPDYLATLQRVKDGAIGDVVGGQVYWNQGGLWNHDRQPGWSDVEWQIRNWLYFPWLSGDHIVEQHVHNLDIAQWVLGHPQSVVSLGGRQVRTDPKYGCIYDHFATDLVYPNGVHVMSMCRQIDGTASNVSEHFVGTKGTTDAHSYIDGANPWRYQGQGVDPYVQEHADNIAAIRAGRPLNEGHRIAESVLMAIMSRESAYTGQEISWEQALNSKQDLMPKNLDFGPLPVPPVPKPGETKFI
jgi:predicted dehydrogenase